MTDEPSKRRRWLQFRLRTLLIAVLVLSLPLSWFAVRLERARRQREAVETIRQLGGAVRYGYHDSICDPAEHPPVPSLFLKLLGDDFFSDVVGVGFFHKNGLCDDNLAVLDALPELDFVELQHVPITDHGLRYLAGIRSVTTLSLDGTRITDAGLEHLAELSDLTFLCLDNTQVTDAGLEHLKGLSKLQHLSVANVDVTPDGIKRLQAALPTCEIRH